MYEFLLLNDNPYKMQELVNQKCEQGFVLEFVVQRTMNTLFIFKNLTPPIHAQKSVEVTVTSEEQPKAPVTIA